MLFPILTILTGLLTASALIVARKPNAQAIFDRVRPYQALFGVGVFAMGVFWFIRWLPNLSLSLSTLPGMIVLGMIVMNILLGFMLGFSVLSGWLARNDSAKEKSDALVAKLTTAQIPLGVGAVALGVASFVV